MYWVFSDTHEFLSWGNRSSNMAWGLQSPAGWGIFGCCFPFMVGSLHLPQALPRALTASGTQTHPTFPQSLHFSGARILLLCLLPVPRGWIISSMGEMRPLAILKLSKWWTWLLHLSHWEKIPALWITGMFEVLNPRLNLTAAENINVC